MITGLTPEATLVDAVTGTPPDDRVDATLELAWRLRLRDPTRSRALVQSVHAVPEAAGRRAIFALRQTSVEAMDTVLALAARPDVDPLWSLRALVVGADRLLDGLATTAAEALTDQVRAALDAAAGDVGPTDMQAVENMLGRVAMLFRDRSVDALAHYERAAELSALAGEVDAQVINLVNAASVLGLMQDPGGAMERYLRALRVLESQQDVQPRVLGFVHGNIAVLYWRFGSLTEARHHAHESVVVSRRQDRPHLLVFALAGRIRIGLTDAQLDAVREDLDELERVLESGADLDGLRQLAANLRAAWLVASGQPADALRHLEQAGEIEDEEGAIERAQIRAHASTRLGRHGEAVAWVEPVRQAVLRVRDPLHERVIDEHVVNLQALGRHEDAIAFLQERTRFLRHEPRRLARLRMDAVVREVEVRTARARADDASAHARSLQTQLQRAQRLEAFGQLAAGLAHDVNNALSVVVAAADQLAQGSAPSEKAASLDTLNRAVDQATSITRRLLTIARQSELHAVDLSLDEHLVALLPVVQTAAGHCRVDLQIEAHVQVRADPNLLDQALLNLVLNARDAMEDGGTVTVRLDASHRRARLTVEDCGPGIAPDVLQHVFDPFFTTKGSAGTGLGLAMVWGIAQQLGGDVSVQSEPGQGARFTIALPAEVVREVG